MSDTPNVPKDRSAVAPEAETDYPTPGNRWKGTFLIKASETLATGASAWTGLDIDQMEEVLLVAARSQGTAEEGAWKAIIDAKLPNAYLPKVSHRARETRIDVYKAGAPLSLREWRDETTHVSDAFFEALLLSCVDLLERLHKIGAGHFNLSPDTILVDESEPSAPRFQIGGWDTASSFATGELIPLPVDPLYAPPEAAGLTRHAGNEDLALWDWWSLGRTLQEVLLGHPVVSQIFGQDKGRQSRELRHCAEELLHGRAPGGLRIGAVEAMGNLDERKRALLQGLLTTAKDGRWRQAECRLWLKGETPRNHYLMSGKERCFRMDGRAYTIQEAAQFLNREEVWKKAWEQLMLPKQPETLACFVNEHGPDTTKTQCAWLRTLKDEKELADFPAAAVEEATLALLLLELARGELIWRGRRVDSETLAAYLGREDGEGLWLGAVWALTTPRMQNYVEAFDTAAGRVLSDLGKLAAKAANKANAHGWIRQSDIKSVAELWRLACANPSTWTNARDSLRKIYACSSQAAVDRIFQDDRAAASDNLLLAFMASNPSAYGFVTHEAWAARECKRLHDASQQTLHALFWRRLRWTLRLNPWLFGGILGLVLPWLGAALALALVFPGPRSTVLALLPLLLVATLRLTAARHIDALTKKWTPGVARWRLLDSSRRCLDEENRLGSASKTSEELRLEIRKNERQIEELRTRVPDAPRLAVPPRFFRLKLTALACWLLLVGTFGFALAEAWRKPPSWTRLYSAWTGMTPEEAVQKEKERAIKEVKIPWPFKEPDEIRKIQASEVRSATEAEKRQASERGSALAQPYIRSTLSTPFLVRIDSESRFAFMLFDGNKDALASPEVYLLLYNPLPRSWLEIDGKRVFVPEN